MSTEKVKRPSFVCAEPASTKTPAGKTASPFGGRSKRNPNRPGHP